MVVWSAALVAINGHGTVSLAVGKLDSVWAVDWDLLVVDTESVSVSVRVREESSLEHLVLRWLNTWTHMAWSESRLLSFSEVVFRVSVEDEFTNVDEWVVTMWPDLGNIEDVPFVVGSISNWHDLDLQRPRGSLSLLDVVEEISGGVVWVFAAEFGSLFGNQILDAGVSLEVELDIEDFALSVVEFKSVA